MPLRRRSRFGSRKRLAISTWQRFSLVLVVFVRASPNVKQELLAHPSRNSTLAA
jgi:hypothetical protein